MKLLNGVPGAGNYQNRRGTVIRTASQAFAQDIIDGLKLIDYNGTKGNFVCDSFSLRSVKVATLLFNEEEPIIAAKMAIMESTVTGLLDGQKTLFKLLEERLPERVASSSLNQKENPEKNVVQAASFAGAVKSDVPTIISTKSVQSTHEKEVEI